MEELWVPESVLIGLRHELQGYLTELADRANVMPSMSHALPQPLCHGQALWDRR